MQRIGQHPATAIVRGINDLVRIGCGNRQIPIMVLEEIRTTEWASITFTGLRHELDLRLEGGQDSVTGTIVRLAETLADTEFSMAGYFLAEIAVAAVETGAAIVGSATEDWGQRFRIDALTIRD